MSVMTVKKMPGISINTFLAKHIVEWRFPINVIC